MKNPAVLWYPSDFISSTIFWTNEQCGAYIRLLNYQFTLGHLKMSQIKQITNDEEVIAKFEIDDKGLYYNKRMDFEIDKRNKFNKHQIENGSLGGAPIGNSNAKKNNPKTSQKQPKNKPLENINENININSNINIYEYYEKELGRTISPSEIIKINTWLEYFGEDKTRLAIDTAVDHGCRTSAYINGILKNWKDKTLLEIKEEEKKYNQEKSKENKKAAEPVWLNKQIDSEKATESEQAELNKMLEDIK